MDLYTKSVSLLNSPLSDMVDELRDLRASRFAHTMEEGTVFVFLTAFYLPDDQSRFVRIRPEELGERNRVLNTRVRDFSDLTIHTLLSELAEISHGDHGDLLQKRLYVALNDLMRPICMSMKKPKPKPLSPRKRLAVLRQRNRSF